MIGPGEAIVALIVIGLPIMMLGYAFHRFFKFREKQLDADTRLAAEKAAQYAASNAELEARVRVLEQIVTDRGAETAAQIEALRSPPRIAKGDKVQ
jgi:ABC-type phosphate transport system auxiliary subunit